MLLNVADEFYSDYFVQALQERVITNEDGNIWNAIEKLIRTQCEKISEALMMELVSQLYIRLDAEFKVISTQNVKQTLNAIKIIQILSALAEKSVYLKLNNKLVSLLWQLAEAYQKANVFGFED